MTSRVGYADPPYPGQSKKHYEHHEDYAGEVDHRELIGRLERDYDGWVLHTGSVNLSEIVPLCPEGVRYGAWVKSFASFKPGVTQAYAWEPVIFRIVRSRPKELPTVRDWIMCPITLKKGLSGVKPAAVCYWAFEFLGLCAGDDLDDIYPGSGAVSRAWDSWRAQGVLLG